MDLEKTYDKMDWEELWAVFKVYGVARKLLDGVKAFCREISACVKVKELGESCRIQGGERQGCVMSSWLFCPPYIDGLVVKK